MAHEQALEAAKQSSQHPVHVMMDIKSKIAQAGKYPYPWKVEDTKSMFFKTLVETVENISQNRPFFQATLYRSDMLDQSISVAGQKAGTWSNPDVKLLSSWATPAPFGKGVETVVDKTIRQACEIAGDQLVVNDAFALSSIRHQILTQCQFKARLKLYKMHIYEVGGHFTVHRDTPHGPLHVGTVVVVLPVPHQGGTLEVEHMDQKLKLTGSSERVEYAFFYNDCRHRVLPVTAGKRVILQYDVYHVKYALLKALPATAAELWQKDACYFELDESTRSGKFPRVKEMEEVDEVSQVDEVKIDWEKRLEHQVSKAFSEEKVEALGFVLSHHYPWCYLDSKVLKDTDQKLYQILSSQGTYDLSVKPVIISSSTDYEGTWDSISVVPFGLEELTLLEQIERLPWDKDERKVVLKRNRERVPESARYTVTLIPPHSEMTLLELDRKDYSEHTGNEACPGEATYFSVVLVVKPRCEPDHEAKEPWSGQKKPRQDKRNLDLFK